MTASLRRLALPPAIDWVLALLLAVGAFVHRFVHFPGFQNDHFVMIARSFQVHYGAWPVRDFFDPGMPLAYLPLAALMPVFGPTTLPEVALQTALFGVTVGLTFVVARRASGSVLLGLALTVVVIAMMPRLYNSTKVLMQAAALGAAWWYARRPRPLSVAVMGLVAGVFFLVRHDYAVYISGAAVALVIVAREARLRDWLRDGAIYAAATAVCVLPWLGYVHWVGGDVVEYVQSAMRFSAAEGQRTFDLRPALPLFLIAPIVLLVLTLTRRRTQWAGPAWLAFAGIFVLLVDIVLLRDGSEARIPDVVTATAIAAAALLGALPRLVVTGAGAVILAGAIAWWPQAWPLPPEGGVQPAADRMMAAVESWRQDYFPVYSVVPVTDYLKRCTAPTTRVLVVDFGPQVPVYAHRPFAGGTPVWLPMYYEHEADVRTAMRWLEKETIGVILMMESADAFTKSWPTVAQYFKSRQYTPGTIQGEGAQFDIWLAPPPPGSTVDAVTGLPCGY